MNFGSVCSGIEAASVAFGPLGWKAEWFAEIEPFPSAVLAHHYPGVPNLGDMTKIAHQVLDGSVAAPELLCGGTPCQAFSVAGLRNSMADERGGLTLKFVELANAIDHVRTRRGEDECIVFWENVPGVLSTKDNAFGCFLGALVGESVALEPTRGGWTDAGCVYGPKRAAAWRVLDAQYFGLAQRRRRVFVVASARSGFDPAAVLFESEGLRRDTAPSRKARQVAPTIPSRSTGSGGLGTDFDCDGGLIASTLQANGKAAGSATQQDAESGLLVTQAFGGNKTSGPRSVAPALSALSAHGGTGRMDFETETFVTHALRADGTHLVQVLGFQNQGTNISVDGDISATLRCGADRASGAAPCIAFDTTQITSAANRSNPKPGDPCHPLAAGAHAPAIAFAHQDTMLTMLTMLNGASTPAGHNGAMVGMQVRRLTPMECERLQGFPDNYTQIPDWSGWRKLDAGENPEGCEAIGLKVKRTKKTGIWWVNDPDGPRYKALGNSWAVPNVRWIGVRIQAVCSMQEPA